MYDNDDNEKFKLIQCSRKDKCVNPSGSLLPLFEFSKDKYKKNGRSSSCKYCESYYRGYKKRQYRIDNGSNIRWCASKENCVHPNGPNLSISEFGLSKSTSDGFNNYCKMCIRSKSKIKYIEDQNRKLLNLDNISHKTKECVNNQHCSNPLGCVLLCTMDNFYLNLTNHDGLSLRCKICVDQGNMKYITMNKDVPNGYKYCPSGINCLDLDGPILKVSKFSKSSKSSDGLRYNCKSCELNRSTKYNKIHPDKHKKSKLKYKLSGKESESSKRRRMENPEKQREQEERRRARELGLPVNFKPRDKQRGLQYAHGCCFYCGNSLIGLFNTAGFKQSFNLTWEHIIPISYNNEINPGTVSINMIPVCGHCNSSRGNKNLNIWLENKFGRYESWIILRKIKEYQSWLMD